TAGPAEKSKANLGPSAADTSVMAKKAPSPEPKKAVAGESAKSQLGSGMPLEALEQIFLFTDGEGPDAMRSPFTSALLEEVIGATLESLRDQVTKSVFG